MYRGVKRSYGTWVTRMLRKKSQLCGKDHAFGLRCVAWSCLWEVDGRWVSAAGNVVCSWEMLFLSTHVNLE